MYKESHRNKIDSNIVSISNYAKRHLGRNSELSGDLLSGVEDMLISACFSSADNSDLLDALSHHLKSGGKRTRALLCIKSGLALGLDNKSILLLAVCCELLHNASLIQDDLQDGDMQRRDEAAVWVQFGTDTAIGLVDLMIASAFKTISSIDNISILPALIHKLHQAIANTLQGQSLDNAADKENHNLEKCLYTAQKKSGPLFSLALELPLITSGYSDATIQAYEAACAFGAGYQLYDDLMDFHTDHLNGCSNNIVLVLNQDMSLEDSISEAKHISSLYLSIAYRVARTLPQNSGDTLTCMIDMLREKLRGITHE